MDKGINEANPLLIAETLNTFQTLAYDATSPSRIVQPQLLIDRPESPIVSPHFTEVPSQPPSPLSSQDTKGKEDAKQTSSFLNKLPLISEPGEINCIQADYLNDFQLLPQLSIALTQSPIVRPSDANKRSQDINYTFKNNSRENKKFNLVAPKLSVPNNKSRSIESFKPALNRKKNEISLNSAKSQVTDQVNEVTKQLFINTSSDLTRQQLQNNLVNATDNI